MKLGAGGLLLIFLLRGWPLSGLGPDGGHALAEPLSPRGAVVLPRSGQTTVYGREGQASSSRDSGQDGELQRGAVWPEPRFLNNGDGTVTDQLTGLMWLKDGSCLGAMDWGSGGQRVADFNRDPRGAACLDYRAPYNDWVLPNLNELASLLNAGEAVPAAWLNSQSFSNVAEQGYWSSTSYLNRFNGWSVGFGHGQIGFQAKIEPLYLLPVRRPEGVAARLLPVGEAKSSAPADDSARQAPVPKASSRFQEHGDGTVSDTLTGLMWLADAGCLPPGGWPDSLAAAGEFNKKSGSFACQGYSAAYQDWALPNAVELRSLVDYGSDYPALAAGHPFRRLEPVYWSATTAAHEPRSAVGVNFQLGATAALAKEERHGVWLVRGAKAAPPQTRLSGAQEGKGAVAGNYRLMAETSAQSNIVWPPSPRFVDLGDGTSLDIVTSLIWLTDTGCLGKKSLAEAKKALMAFNSRRDESKCKGYTGQFDDWKLPTREQMLGVLPPGVKDGVAWLNSEGLSRVKGSADYWTATLNPINLYYAQAVNLKRGVTRDYATSFQFYFWPVRLPAAKPAEPVISMAVNGQEEQLTVTAKEPLTIKLFLHTFGRVQPAVYWFWYETPGGRVWLTPARKWSGVRTPLYQGNLFNLMNYEVFRSVANGLAAGSYTFHFGIELNPAAKGEKMDYQTQVTLSIPE